MRYKHLATIALSILAITSCMVDEGFISEDTGMIPVNIAGTINQVHTKATAEGFVNGDAVGLFAVNYTDNNAVAGILASSGNQADNVKYVFNEGEYKWVPVRPVYYKNINTHVDLFLYYPYMNSISDVNAANFEVQKDQSSAPTSTSLSGYEASDWMWGKGTDITPSESRVSIMLSHRLSAVQVTLTEGTGFEEGEFEALSKGVILTNTTRKATLDFTTGTATPLGGAQSDGIVMCPQQDGSFRAIVIPQTVAAGAKLFAITIDGVSYGFKQDAAVSYQAGKQLSVTININKKSATGEYELTLGGMTIINWTEDRNSHGGEARQYYVVNVATPGTLGQTIRAAGKNPAKIRNLKVTGEVTTEDFYFMRDSMDILEAINMKESRVINGRDQHVFIINHYEYTTANDIIPYEAFAGNKSLIYFVFPETITKIGNHAFTNTRLSGTLIIPNDVERIDEFSFYNTNITSIQFNNCLKTIGNTAFGNCKSLIGDLLLPDSVVSIESSVFKGCNFNGKLHLPANLEIIENNAFNSAGSFTGGLTIPEKVQSIGSQAFQGALFSGELSLSSVQEIGSSAFYDCRFSGSLVIPEGVIGVESSAFCGNRFSEVVLPTTIRSIGSGAFRSNNQLENITLPEGLVTISENAFSGANRMASITFPSTLLSIGNQAFYNCYNISSITCDAIVPPSIGSGAFSGVAKDNFTVGVPAQSVKRYQAESGWGDFKRIAANYNFSLSRQRMRALNGAQSRTYTLRAPANYTWSVDDTSLPDWITVSPMTGIGKTDVTVSVVEMPRTNDKFEVNEGTFSSPSYKQYKGRSGEVTFVLDEKGSTFTFDVEQYDYDYYDGYVQTLQTASVGAGIDFVFTGEGYDAKDIAKGTFAANAAAGYGHLFDLEPYKTYKDYFNVYVVTAQSDDSGIGTVNTVKDSKFGTHFTQNRILCEQPDAVFAWAKKADASMNLSQSLVILLMNTSTYEGICYMYGDGSALACCPVSTETYPYDFRGIVQHEAGGHGFGKLADEYIYHNAYIQNCNCLDCEHPKGDDDVATTFGMYKAKGWFKNLSMNSDMRQVPWAHLIYHPKYSDYVDMYEGGYKHMRGIYRSEATSCMNNNIPYYSAISRQAIVERIKAYAGEEFSLEEFYANDDDSFGTKASIVIDRTFGVDPNFIRGSANGPVYMGEHPNVK